MKIYHGGWDDSPKEFIAECNTANEVLNVIKSYAPNSYYIRWIDDTAENKQVIADYGSWFDFIFINGVNYIGELLGELFE